MKALRVVLCVVLFAVGVPVRADEAGELHIYVEPGEDWPRALYRLPLSALASDQPRGLAPFLHATPPRISTAAYEADFTGFAQLLTGQIGFSVAGGDDMAPGLGAMTMIDTRGASGPFAGLVPNLSLLDICGDPPEGAPLDAVELVVLLLLFDAAAGAPLDVSLPAGAGRMQVTDHRTGTRITATGPRRVSLPAAR